MYKKIYVEKIAGEQRTPGEDVVVLDERYSYCIDGEEKFALTIVPSDIVEAGIGHMIGEGIISAQDVVDYEIEGKKINFSVKKKESKKIKKKASIERGTISKSMSDMLQNAQTWKRTGGVHVAALYDLKGKLLHIAEDIGKGNAIDKVIGKAAISGADFSNSMLLSTGRMAGFLVLKAVKAGIPIAVSRGAPIASGIEAAKNGGLTLVCFARGKKMNVYTHGERIL